MITGAKVEDPLNKIWLLSVSAEASVFAPSSFLLSAESDLLLPHPTLFGSTSILTLKIEQVWLCVVLSVVVVVLFIVFYHKIFCVTFDETFAKATGIRADRYNLLIAVITALIIVLAMNLVGSLLISALVIFPALSAMRIFKTFFSVTVCSVVLSVCCAISGMLLSILAGTPVGSTIVAADIVAFLICCMIEKIAGGK